MTRPARYPATDNLVLVAESILEPEVPAGGDARLALAATEDTRLKSVILVMNG